MTTTVGAERPDTADARTLIAELDAQLAPLYPQSSRHGYAVEKLLREGVAFFVIRNDGVAAGCCGVQFFGLEYGEVKRMYVRPRFRRLGLGKLMLRHLAAYARQHGVGALRLETGIYQQEAIGLYEHMGFRATPPFGTYRDDPLSKFYEFAIV